MFVFMGDGEVGVQLLRVGICEAERGFVLLEFGGSGGGRAPQFLRVGMKGPGSTSWK